MTKRSSNPADRQPFFPRRIISGGQTGVDRAGLELAIAHRIQHGGWCPKGRLSEDGSIPSRYDLVEMDTAEYPPRTEQNVIDSDATLILYEQRLKGGTLLTRRYAARWNKPCLSVAMEVTSPGEVRQWLDQVQPETLNIAGPRESSVPGIGERALAFLLEAFVDRSTEVSR
ncbi:Putative molybdenum carrier [Stieleria maiorica]|uniref:Molybdenum carrier n=1 Tax=Stieleria maiorica TaxID=2795974 RepID=A0A5B9MHW8_9BACT|nr:putative molybdenum carrier protein [Stieleria maiorica]QEG00903.1 Putative molybdenum carrier [Stieleria maiorica]